MVTFVQWLVHVLQMRPSTPAGITDYSWTPSIIELLDIQGSRTIGYGSGMDDTIIKEKMRFILTLSFIFTVQLRKNAVRAVRIFSLTFLESICFLWPFDSIAKE